MPVVDLVVVLILTDKLPIQYPNRSQSSTLSVVDLPIFSAILLMVSCFVCKSHKQQYQ